MKQHPDLLAEIDGFLAETGMGASYFGKKAASNSELVKRLRDGRRVWPETERMVRAFIAAERSRKMVNPDCAVSFQGKIA